MAGGVNKVILVGNLGADPDMRYTPSGAGVCELRLATNESWTDKDGAKQERTEWHRIVVWGKRAENCSKYLSKGRQVYVEGKLRTRSWEDKDGNKRWTTEVIANDVQFLSGGAGGGNQGGGDYPPPAEPDGGGFGGGNQGGGFGGSNQGGGFAGGSSDDDIPF